MNPEQIEFGVSLFIAAIALVVGARAWRQAVIAWTRQEVFEIRDHLFDAAVAAGAERHVSYREARDLFNGYLRFAEELTGSKLIYYAIRGALMGFGRRPPVRIAPDCPVAGQVELALKQFSRAMVVHVMLGTTVGLPMAVLLAFERLRRRGRRMLGEFLERIGSDDEFAQAELGRWRGPMRPAT